MNAISVAGAALVLTAAVLVSYPNPVTSARHEACLSQHDRIDAITEVACLTVALTWSDPRGE